MANILQKLFGTKSDRDLKELRPILAKIQSVYPTIEQLSNDDLRKKTLEFKQKIKDATNEDEQRITQIKSQMDANYDMPISEKESFFVSAPISGAYEDSPLCLTGVTVPFSMPLSVSHISSPPITARRS